MADTHSHDPRCTGTSIPTSLVAGAWPAVGAHGHQPRHTHNHAAVSHAPPAGQRRRVLRIGPVIGRFVAVVPSHKLRRARADLGSWLLRYGAR